MGADAERDFDHLLRAMLRQMVRLGEANGGALFLYDRNVQGLVRRVTEGAFVGKVCSDVRLTSPQLCPALLQGNGMALYGPRAEWPPPCRKVSAKGGAVYCLPLIEDEHEIGIVQLGYAGHTPSPPSRYLPALMDAAGQVAQVIQRAWTNVQAQERALALSLEWELELKRTGPDIRSSTGRLNESSDGAAPGPTPPFLEIRCFGPFELYRQGKLVTTEMFQRRGALTLLKILLMYRGRPVPRDRLVELLWPETDPQAGANRLYILVHTLRRVLEPSPQPQACVFICRIGDGYYFNRDAPHRLDVEEFLEAIGLGVRLEREGEVARAMDAYQAAVNLYRGDFLEDQPYDEWCWFQREEFREMFLDVLRKLAALSMKQRIPERSIDLYRQALKMDPVREQMHQGLMRALWVAGRRDEALRQYQACRDILGRELNVEPLPETEELYRAIRQQPTP